MVAAHYRDDNNCQGWYRARIRNFVNHGQLRVFYIDYGTTRVVR